MFKVIFSLGIFSPLSIFLDLISGYYFTSIVSIFKVSVCALRLVERKMDAIKMPNSEQNHERSVATKDDSSNADDLINIKFTISRLNQIEKMPA